MGGAIFLYLRVHFRFSLRLPKIVLRLESKKDNLNNNNQLNYLVAVRIFPVLLPVSDYMKKPESICDT